MASTDARPIPIKNTAYRATFPIWDADGDLVTGATGLDSEVSLDAGTFGDCSNEATEIATASGMYYLDLTSGEMNADTVAVIVKTTTVGAKTTALVLYPQELGDIKVDVQSLLGTVMATPTVAGVPEVDVTHWIGTAAATPTVAGVPEVDVTHWRGAAVPAPATAGTPAVNATEVGGQSQTAGDIITQIALVDARVVALPTAIQNADALLDRNMATGADNGSASVRTVRQALRFNRNKWAVVAGTLTVNKEDDVTPSWTAAVTQTAGNPVSSIDPV